MEKLSIKERIIYHFIFNEERVYKLWYSRFLVAGVDLDSESNITNKERIFMDGVLSGRKKERSWKSLQRLKKCC